MNCDSFWNIVIPAGEGMREKSAAQKAVDAGVAAMVQIPAESTEAADPVECAREAQQKLQDAFKGAEKASRAGEDFNRKAQANELQSLSKQLGETLHTLKKQSAHDKAAELSRLSATIEDGAIVLPAGTALASMWDPMTWAYAFMALFPHGDLVPYLDRSNPPSDAGVDMTLRETFAYLLAREELAYPLADGAPPPAPLEPCRWAYGPWAHVSAP